MNLEPANKRIAIIGCGYVGSAAGEALVKAGHDVIGTTTDPMRSSEIEALGITPVVLEHAHTDRLHTLLRDRHVVYLTFAAGRKRRDYREVYLEGVKNLRRAIIDTTVTRIIYTSSTQVYGQDDGSWVDESSPTQPQTENGRVLLATEQALLEWNRAAQSDERSAENPVSAPAGGPRRDSRPSDARPVGPRKDSRSSDGASRPSDDASLPGEFCATVVRLGGIHGPGRDLSERIRAAAGQERNDADAYVNLIHRDDIVTALVRLLDVPYDGVLNLTDDTPVQRRELYDHIITAAGLSAIRWVQADRPRKLGKRIRNDCIKKKLGLILAHPAAINV